MQNYMLTILVKNDLDEASRGALLEAVKKQFDSVVKEDLWGNRGLAYPIKHQDKAFYAHYEFQAEQNKISALDKSLKLNEDIIRFLLTKKEDKRVKIKKGKAFKPVEEKAEEVGEEKSEEVKEEVKE